MNCIFFGYFFRLKIPIEQVRNNYAFTDPAFYWTRKIPFSEIPKVRINSFPSNLYDLEFDLRIWDFAVLRAYLVG